MAALSALFAAAFYAFVYAPQRAALRETEAEALALRRDMARVEAFLRAHERGPEELAALADRADRARAMLPETLETARFAMETARYAAEAGLTLEGVAPEAADAPRPPDGADASFTGGYSSERNGGPARQRLRISVRGDYFALLDFLFLLEQGGRFARVEAVRGRVDDAGVFQGTLEVWIYARRP